MAAIAATLMGLLKAGDRLLAQSCLYGGTHSLFTGDLPDFGMQVDFIDGNRPGTWEKAATAETRAIYVETMTNPLLEVADLEAVTAFAREHGLTSIIDNTFGTPVNYRPLQRGFDVEIHSATKYLNGHSDIVAGLRRRRRREDLPDRAPARPFRGNPRSARLLPAAPGDEDHGAAGAAPERQRRGPRRDARALRGGGTRELPRAGPRIPGTSGRHGCSPVAAES